MNKVALQQALIAALTEKRTYFQTLIDGIVNEMADNAKSSAGDKHETSTSMAQNEQEKIGQQIFELEKQIELVKHINPNHQATKIALGSVIKTAENTFYLSIGFGKIVCDNEPVLCISPNAPLGKLFIGKSTNDSVVFNQQEHKICAID
jgi:transcription elongation GreA/GreB family factor